MLDVSGSMGMPSTTAEQARLQAVNPDNFGLISYWLHVRLSFHRTGSLRAIQPEPIPAVGQPTNPSPGGYCQGFIISRLGTSPVSFANNTTNTTNGSKVNSTNPQVSSCASAGTTSCIQLRLDAVGYAVNALLTTANSTEGNDGITNQFRVGVYPFIQNLCYSGVNGPN